MNIVLYYKMWQKIKIYVHNIINRIYVNRYLLLSGLVIGVSFEFTKIVWQEQCQVISLGVTYIIENSILSHHEYKGVIRTAIKLLANAFSAYCAYKISFKLLKEPIAAAVLLIGSIEISRLAATNNMEATNVPESAIAALRFTDSIAEGAGAQYASINNPRNHQLTSLCDIASPDNLD